MFNYISYVSILKQFAVLLCFSEIDQTKINTYGTTREAHDFATSGDIFKGNRGEYVGSFSTFLGIQYVLYVEVMGVILAIKYVRLKDFSKVLVGV